MEEQWRDTAIAISAALFIEYALPENVGFQDSNRYFK